jgi:hypothetical protein
MDTIHIAELHPELPARDTKHFKAAVTLIWPWSSSQRQFALLLAEPDFRLRRKKGQVRARFSGSSAKALATTGVGIGDVVILSLRGAQFVQEDIVSTPGRSIDWELQYTQTVAVQVFRDGNEIANLELQDVAPTPAPRSPVRRQTNAIPSPIQEWSSPAFLKRARLSDGPFFEAPYDPLADENAEGHDKKRRRKSYRDWKAWTYSARTPSPEKGDVGTEEDMDDIEASPSRPSQLPRTPVSPPKTCSVSVAAGPLQEMHTAELEGEEPGITVETAPNSTNEEVKTGVKAPQVPQMDDFERDDDYYDLYAGPDEDRPVDSQYAFGGDTEANTEDEALEDTDAASVSPTEANTEDLEQEHHETDREPVEVSFGVDGRGPYEADAGSTTEEGSFHQISQSRDAIVVTIDDADHNEELEPVDVEALERAEASPVMVMPPPTLPTLNTSFPAPGNLGMLTPIGKEPSSPTLKPLDSALLPLPSPFPGESDATATSYLDHVSAAEEDVALEAEEERPPSEADYIMENSFFSSIGSSKANPFHPDHETAFTPVRFTFGMDGAGYSRPPLDLSLPAPEERKEDVLVEEQHFPVNETFGGLDEVPEIVPPETEVDDTAFAAVMPPVTVGFTFGEPPAGRMSSAPTFYEPKAVEPEIIELSSDRASVESSESKVEGDFAADQDATEEDNDSANAAPTSTSRSEATSTIVALGSPPASSEAGDVIPETLNDSDAPEDRQESVPPTPEPQIMDQDHESRPDHQPSKPANVDSHSELVTTDYAPAFPEFDTFTQEEANTHSASQERLEVGTEVNKDMATSMGDHLEPCSAMDILDTVMEESYAEWETQLEDHHPDMKLESIEEGSIFQVGELGTQEGQELNDANLAELSGEMLIEVPDEGHKIGELHTIAVPAAGPARNTRSKAKTSASSITEEISPPKRNTRSTRSKASVTPIAQTTMSPPRTQTRSTMSPSVEASQTSPYGLRSQSKMLSPTKSTSVATATTRRSPRKHASQRSVDSIPDVGSSQLQDLDPFLTSFQPSQELGASQRSRYSDVTFVKDSEEESLHSEHSLSTVKYSDDWNMFTNFSDPPMGNEQDEHLASLKPPPASAPETVTRTRAGKKTEAPTVINTRSSSVLSRSSSIVPPSSPGRKLRSAGSAEATSTSAQIRRSTRQHSRNVSAASQQSEEVSGVATPKARDVTYPALLGESEVIELLSSPPASGNVDEQMRSSPPAVTVISHSIDHQSITDSNRPITPDATQQTNMESQNSFLTGRRQQTLPMTPQLTQATSVGLRSFTQSMTADQTAVESPIKSSPTRVTRSTPRRNATQNDVASPSTTPKEHSPDISSDHSTTAVENIEVPSIGLSTPLAYYTPLSSLPYFLNRSSQFHTSSNPDVLALVTSATTPPQRATKGRKDWTTTFHITDASTYPATTTVNIFRPYQSALPAADVGDIILLRAFAVKSVNRHPTLTSADESSWCVWRYKKPVWGAKRGAYGELRAREEVKGPVVERGEGEWREVEVIRGWFTGRVKGELEERVVHTRSQDRKEGEDGVEGSQGQDVGKEEVEGSQRVTRSKDKAKSEDVV